MGFVYALRLADGDDAGEYETGDAGIQPGDEIRANGNRLMRVRAVIPAAKIGEFVDGVEFGVLEVEPL
jgi:hypothetical protein